jgi:predicted nucleic acid-binding Zn ribbon protein
MRSAYHKGLETCCDCYDCYGRNATTVVHKINDTLYPFCDSCWRSFTKNLTKKSMSLEEAKILLIKEAL